MRSVLEGSIDSDTDTIVLPEAPRCVVRLTRLTRAQLRKVKSPYYGESRKRRKSLSASSDNEEPAATPAFRRKRISSHISSRNDVPTSSGISQSPARERGSRDSRTAPRTKKNRKHYYIITPFIMTGCHVLSVERTFHLSGNETPSRRPRATGGDFVPLATRRTAVLEVAIEMSFSKLYSSNTSPFRKTSLYL